ncbi:HET-domain-containing protein [Venturia nashicola]|uniref:HET-domain-containing protein n=1 Tax=Venturia nashicola TaxID=86259 RepID=A0A4Z1PGA3_9PEZI|nr:HET-domain-containing protein [Venturia nashicola]
MQTDEEYYKGKVCYGKIKGSCELVRVELTPIDWISARPFNPCGDGTLMLLSATFRWRMCLEKLLPNHLLPTRPSTLRDLHKNDKYITRAWTLQEPLAHKEVVIFPKTGTALEPERLREIVLEAARIDLKALDGIDTSRSSFKIAQRMCEAADRNCSIFKDIAYCLIGMFNVSIRVLHGGNREKAIFRLQEEIVKQINEESLLA